MKRILLAAGTLALLLSATTVRVSAQAPTAPAGLYVTDLQIAPSLPTVGNTFTFTASFLNTATGEQNMKWRVLIYRAAAAQKSYSDTTWLASSFPVGASVKLSDGDWYLPLGTPCDYYFARVVWMDGNNQSIPFLTPDGRVFEKGFNTCP